MSLLVTGTVGIDTVTTPYGHVEDVLGGTVVYFAFAARQYVPVRLVAVVGDDFPEDFRRVLESHDIDLAGLEVRPGSKTFRWAGRFVGDMNVAETVDLQLNVLAEDPPRVPAAFADSDTIFLGGTDPALQRELLGHVRSPKLVVCDTKDHWIVHQRDSFLETLRMVTGAIINDGEARLLTERVNLIEAGEAILDLGLEFVIIKKGEHGALLVTQNGPAAVPAYPTKAVRDPTGAGDSFGGGVLGYLARQGKHDPETLRRAMVHGTVAASFTIEDFSLRKVQDLTRAEVNQRVDQFISMLRFD